MSPPFFNKALEDARRGFFVIPGEITEVPVRSDGLSKASVPEFFRGATVWIAILSPSLRQRGDKADIFERFAGIDSVVVLSVEI